MPKQSQATIDALVDQRIKDAVKELNRLNKIVSENDKQYHIIFCTQKDFDFIRNIVLTFCGIILTGVALAVVRLVTK